MKALILAAGHGTRLYPLTFNTAKPLLKIVDKPICEYIVDELRHIKEIEEIYIVVNAKFFESFLEWQKAYCRKHAAKITIVNDKTSTDADKRGAIGDIEYALKACKIDEDLLIIGGDNFFDFELKPFVKEAKKYHPSFCVGLYDYKYRIFVTKYGVVSINKGNQITDFEEKPNDPKSTLISMCLYFLPREKITRVGEYLRAGHSRDAVGNFVKWFYKKEKVYGITLRGTWFDIGDIESYKKSEEFVRAQKKRK
jgi:glucose-1-phosphate thymidylyltransferase